MADMVQFRSCLASEIGSKAIVNGSLIVCSDTGDMYHDTSDGERIRISKEIEFLATDAARTALLTPESDRLYLVVATGKLYIYNTSWQLLNPDATSTVYVHNVELAAGSSTTAASTVVSVPGAKTTSTATFTPIPALVDLVGSGTFTCTCTTNSVTVASTVPYVMYGVLEVKI